MRVMEELITPQRANELLNDMVRNRKPNKKRVECLTDAMKNGTFTECVDPIAISSNGVLLNGQHRLLSIIRANVSVKMLVAYDVPMDAVIDKGLSRSFGDSLYMRGMLPYEQSRQRIVSISRMFLALKKMESGLGFTEASKSITEDELGDFISKNYEKIKRAYDLSRNSKTSVLNRSGGHVAILAALMCGEPDAKVERFCYVTNTGFMKNESETAAVVVRNQIIKYQINKAIKQDGMAKLVQIGIRDFVLGNSRRNMYNIDNLTNYYIERAEA